jgi:3-oxoacyl-[acyl-carrier-protein] synthase II
VFVLETLESARARGARIYAEVAGSAACADAYHLVAPCADGEGAARAIRWALDDAGLGIEDIDYINAHGTSTPLNDPAETAAIKAALGEHAYKVPVSSTKSMIGHALGASGALETVAAVKTIETGIIHPTINYETPDPECDLDYVPNTARRADVRVVLKNSFGFGGQNACLVLKRVDA